LEYKQPEKNIEGWMSQDELQWLHDRASEMESVAEIGSWMGRSTHALLTGCKGKVYAIDHFQGSPSERNAAHERAKKEDIHSIFMKNVGHFPNLIVFKMDAIEASKHFEDKSIEMVFYDADHEYPACKEIMAAWLPKCKKVFCGHDRNQGGTPKALDELNLNPKSVLPNLWSVNL
jgi:predicted O-methyltransferase YrrM